MPHNLGSVMSNEALQQAGAPPCGPRLSRYFQRPCKSLNTALFSVKVICLKPEGITNICRGFTMFDFIITWESKVQVVFLFFLRVSENQTAHCLVWVLVMLSTSP